MINRQIREHIERSLKNYPVVGILGPRQIGKTTLAKTITKHCHKKVVYLDLELPSDLNKLLEPELYLSQFFDALVVIDEIQRMPSLFPLLRALVDKRRIGGRFLILGSASPALIRHASESLAGRIIYHEISPFHVNETGYEHLQKLWLRGGFPLSYLAQDENSFIWREAFIKTYLEMDIPQLGFQLPSIQLRRFWTMLAHSHGQLWNASHLAKSLGITAPTVRTYLDILEETFLVRRLQPYHMNIKKRLIKSPKVYIRDSGLLHALLGIRNLDALQSYPLVGSSWEGFVIEQIISLMQKRHDVYFYRTNAGAEIDLVVFDRKNRPIAIEVKYSASPKAEKGYWIAYEDLSCKKGFVVYPGDESYPIGKNVLALPLRDLARIFE